MGNPIHISHLIYYLYLNNIAGRLLMSNNEIYIKASDACYFTNTLVLCTVCAVVDSRTSNALINIFRSFIPAVLVLFVLLWISSEAVFLTAFDVSIINMQDISY